MKLLIDFLPIVIFFVVYKFCPELIEASSSFLSAQSIASLQDTPAIIIATAVLIPATILQIAYTWFTQKSVEKSHIITLVMVVLLGGATVIFQDKSFIQWKPTVVNWLFAAAFLGSQFIGKQSIIERMMGSNLTLPSQIWIRLNIAWIAFFIFSGLTNLYVAFNYSEDTWVNFKLFGMLGLTLVFVIIQGIYLTRYIPKDDQEQEKG
jgi:intracellular septation protein